MKKNKKEVNYKKGIERLFQPQKMCCKYCQESMDHPKKGTHNILTRCFRVNGNIDPQGICVLYKATQSS